MKAIVSIGLMVLFLFLVVVQWMEYHPSPVPASASASQIYIHGTPVCVFRQGGSIVARVGECEAGTGPRDQAPDADLPDDGARGLGLPPGHPPVGPDMSPDGGGRRVLI